MDRLSGWVRYFLPLTLVGVLLIPLIGGYQALVSKREAYLNRQAFSVLGAASTSLRLEMRSVKEKLESAAGIKDASESKAFLDHYLEDFTNVDAKSKGSDPAPVAFQVETGSSLESGNMLHARHSKGQRELHVQVSLDKLLSRVIPASDPVLFDTILLTSTSGKVLAQSTYQPLKLSDLNDLSQTESLAVPPQPSPVANLEAPKDLVSVSISPSPGSGKQGGKFLSAATLRRAVYIAGAEHLLFIQPTMIEVKVGQQEPVGQFVLVGLLPSSRLHEMSGGFPSTRTTFVLLTTLATLGILWPLVRLKTMSSRERLRPYSSGTMVAGAFASLALLCLLFLSWGFGITLRQRTYFRLEAISDRIERNVTNEIRYVICTMNTLGEKLRQLPTSKTSSMAEHQDWIKSYEWTSPCDSTQVDSKIAVDLNDPKHPKLSSEQKLRLPMSDRQFLPFFEQSIRLQRETAGGPIKQNQKISARAIPTPLRNFNREDYSGLNSLREGDGPYHIHQEAERSDKYDDTITKSVVDWLGLRWLIDMGLIRPNHKQGPANRQFALEPIYSPATGEFLTLIGMRERWFPFGGVPKDLADQKVAGPHHRQIATRLLSLTDVSLPIGFKFAVIEPGGRVLFHSDSYRNLNENFFQECDEPSRFQAIAERRTPSQFVSGYAGSDYFFYVRPLFPKQRHPLEETYDRKRPPIHGLDWTLVVFREAAYVQALQLEAGMLTVSLLVIVALTAIAIFLVRSSYKALGTGKGFAEFSRILKIRQHWPTENRRGHYSALSILGLVGIALTFCMVVLAPFRDLPWLGFLYLLFCVGAAIRIGMVGDRLKRQNAGWIWWAFKQGALRNVGRKSILVTYSFHVACISFAIIGGVMLMLYRTALDATLAEHRTLSRREAVGTFHNRFERIQKDAGRLGLTDDAKQRWINDRVFLSLDVYDPFISNASERLIAEVRNQPHVRLAAAIGRPLLERMWGSSSMEELHMAPSSGPVSSDFPATDHERDLLDLWQLPESTLEERAIGPWPVLPSPFAGRSPAEAVDAAMYAWGDKDLARIPERVRDVIFPEAESLIFYGTQLVAAILLGIWISIVVSELYAQGFDDRRPPEEVKDLQSLFATTARVGPPSRLFFLNQPLTGASRKLRDLAASHPAVLLVDWADSMGREKVSQMIVSLSEAKLLILDNLEFRINEASIDADKLRLIEAAAATNCDIVVLSSIDPVEHLTSLRGESRPDAANRELDEQIARWMRVLAVFEWRSYLPHIPLDWRRNPAFRKMVENFTLDGVSPWPRVCPSLTKLLKSEAKEIPEGLKELLDSYNGARIPAVVQEYRRACLVAFVSVVVLFAIQPMDFAIARHWLIPPPGLSLWPAMAFTAVIGSLIAFIKIPTRPKAWIVGVMAIGLATLASWPLGLVLTAAIALLSLSVHSSLVASILFLVSLARRLKSGKPSAVDRPTEALDFPGNLKRVGFSGIATLLFYLLFLLLADAKPILLPLFLLFALAAAVMVFFAFAVRLVRRRIFPAIDSLEQEARTKRESVMADRGVRQVEPDSHPIAPEFLHELKQLQLTQNDPAKMVNDLDVLAKKYRFASFEATPRDETVRDSHSLDEIFSKVQDELDNSICTRNPEVYPDLVVAALRDALMHADSLGRMEIQPALFFSILSRHVRETREGYFRTIWNTTTKEERLVLYQLSRDGWVNPKNKRAIDHLMRRRILFGGGSHYRTISSAFARFVVDVQPEHEIQEWIAEQKASVWHSLRIGVYSLVIGTLAFLWYVQPQLFHSYLAGLVALSGGIISLFSVYNEIASRVWRKTASARHSVTAS